VETGAGCAGERVGQGYLEYRFVVVEVRRVEDGGFVVVDDCGAPLRAVESELEMKEGAC